MDAAIRAKAAEGMRGIAHKYANPKLSPREERTFGRTMAPDTMNADLMSADEIRRSLEEGYQDAVSERVRDAAEFFTELREHMMT